MPDEETLKDMYSRPYFESDPNAWRFERILKLVKPPGVFMDYGCGNGDLLRMAAAMGFQPIGVEFSNEVVSELKKTLPVISTEEESEPADILHLGDVIEHLTDIESQLPRILSRLKPGGTLIAHNPLEGNMNLFAWTMKISRLFRGRVDGAPYHVTLATTKGQKALFNRMGLTERSFEIEEVFHPAPYSLNEVSSAKGLSLYALRVLSRLVSPRSTGNRYLYVGTKNH